MCMCAQRQEVRNAMDEAGVRQDWKGQTIKIKA